MHMLSEFLSDLSGPLKLLYTAIPQHKITNKFNIYIFFLNLTQVAGKL